MDFLLSSLCAARGLRGGCVKRGVLVRNIGLLSRTVSIHPICRRNLCRRHHGRGVVALIFSVSRHL